MNILNIEIKSRIDNPDAICTLLQNKDALFIGEDNQTDTYFDINTGRLKLRQGNIENALVYYDRPESKDLKRSSVKLHVLPKGNMSLCQILKEIHGVNAVVKKIRKIFYIENVKFHIDFVEGLGNFIEIEAADKEGKYSESYLSAQCEYYIEYLNLKRENFIDSSYCDMILKNLKIREFEELSF